MSLLAEVVSAGESRGGNRAPGHQNGKELHHVHRHFGYRSARLLQPVLLR